MHRDLNVIAKDGARLGINAGGCLHEHELERCNAEGHFGIRSDIFYGRRDQMNAVLDLYREGVAPCGQGPQIVVAVLGNDLEVPVHICGATIAHLIC